MNSALLKSAPIRILLWIFMANFFYDDPTLYLYKRILYSIFIYIALAETGVFYYTLKPDKNSFQMPSFYKVYMLFIFIFITIALFKDFQNPRLNLVTLFNNPIALLGIAPVFIFAIGAHTDDEDLALLLKLLLLISLVFTLVVLLPFFGKVKYYQGYVCANAFIPLLIITICHKKYRILSMALIIFAIYFSHVSDYRVISLRIILFLSLLVAFTITKKWGFLKVLVIALTCFCLYQFIANLQDILYMFKGIIGVKGFDDDDTRGFLWDELFGDMKAHELIFGRGFLGTYFSEYFLLEIVRYHRYGDHFLRFGVEVGFLHLILKGGYIYVILYTFPIIYASLKGIFFTYKNTMVFYLSIYLLTEILIMFIENWPYFSIQFSLIFYLSGYIVRKSYMEKLNDNLVLQ